MLSRVANNLCWLGRYLERTENTARLINVNANLLLDLPRGITLGWEPIVDIVSGKAQFDQKYASAEEKSVITFMVSDSDYPGSLLSSLGYARENARTIREIIPREVWEQINELYLFTKEQGSKAIPRRTRYEFLTEIIESIQKITGILAGTMTHDEGYHFLRIGRNIERADMTTRIIDVRSASLLEKTENEQIAFENLQWMSVLKSLSGYQMYRREMRLRISRPDVLKFLLLEERFPRSLYHTLCAMKASLCHLPKPDAIISDITQVEKELLSANPQSLKQEKLHTFIDEMQFGLIRVFNTLSEVYF
ncbi:alpha-E domain-containing protein [Alteromonas sp. ASW11-36]|uniref:Alpha-E domain-containing protein n=1 Tax=Alteromonas arenosi TaxID=3055817 RepID=A0ABT7T0Z3_9ALTE|nr:alpha-E domain-containing protein [Alteromonas sp. ASW11-36]MDM7862116.1 alpha-E domain-containing protein [Alteromonas sp. ASW11-36]